MSEHQIAVIGAGPAGVAVALSVRDRGLRPLLIDKADEVGSSWRGRYDRLKLNTGRPFSHLPNRRYPKGTPMFPSRDDVVAHLDRHAHEDGIELRLGTTVNRIERRPGGWRLGTSGGDIDARQVVVATGNQYTPQIPEWPGMDGFTGELLHSSQYRNPGRYRGKNVLIIGSGSSGMEIAHDLATGGTAKVWMAVRTPPNIMLRSLPGGLSADVIAVPLYHVPVRTADAISRGARRAKLGDLSEYGLPIPAEGVYSRVKRLDQVPAIIDIDVIDAIRDGSIEVVRTAESFHGDKVILADGTRLEPDAVIQATGYRRNLEPLVGHLGVLDANGKPLVMGEKPAADGLRFIGYTSRPAQIGFVAKQSKRVAKRIESELAEGFGAR
jgi:cation diffusion facilitator CzcD-associated flavoprotein CzcO